MLQPNTALNLNADGYFNYSYQVSYCGAIIVEINSSGNPNMYIETNWNAPVGEFNVNYDKIVTFGTGFFSGSIPVLVSSSYPVTVQIAVGNTNPSNGASGTADILYCY